MDSAYDWWVPIASRQSFTANLSGWGFFVANWVGYGCGFLKSDAQWRIPLAIQIVPAVALLLWVLLAVIFDIPDLSAVCSCCPTPLDGSPSRAEMKRPRLP
jgi:hypothetical protein